MPDAMVKLSTKASHQRLGQQKHRTNALVKSLGEQLFLFC
jgi:hypothetical protein